jgi:hypothetical protein
MRQGRTLQAKPLDVAEIEMVEQASDLEELLARPTNIIDLGAGLGNARLPGAERPNHCGTSVSFNA